MANSNLQKETLAQAISNALLHSKVQSQDDVVILARVVMTDLCVDFTTALRFVNDVITSVLNTQNTLLKS